MLFKILVLKLFKWIIFIGSSIIKPKQLINKNYTKNGLAWVTLLTEEKMLSQKCTNKLKDNRLDKKEIDGKEIGIFWAWSIASFSEIKQKKVSVKMSPYLFHHYFMCADALC
jgi:uncharacterized membrane protein